MNKITVKFKWFESDEGKVNSITLACNAVPRIGETVAIKWEVAPDEWIQTNKVVTNVIWLMQLKQSVWVDLK